MKKKSIYKLFVLLGVIVLVILDQVTKHLAANLITMGDNIVFIPHLLSFGYIINEGAAYGIFEGSSFMLLIVPSFALIVFTVALFMVDTDSKLFHLSFSFILAGSIGNLIDRIFLEGVIDFIEMPFIGYFLALFKMENYYNNLADIFLFAGMGIMIVYFIRDWFHLRKEDKYEKNRSK
ncbi:MAG: signal peptidase II [Acholeplasmatales bacterium]|jgi:signal peptidase II|nr:signal peptidase II [Acholeplasmatales bacterium]